MKALSQRWNNMRQIDGKIAHSKCLYVHVAASLRTYIYIYMYVCGKVSTCMAAFMVVWRKIQDIDALKRLRDPIDPYTNQCQLRQN